MLPNATNSYVVALVINFQKKAVNSALCLLLLWLCALVVKRFSQAVSTTTSLFGQTDCYVAGRGFHPVETAQFFKCPVHKKFKRLI